MIRTVSTVLLFTCLLLAEITWGAADEATPSPESLISRARLQQDIWTAGTPPMSMRADLQFSDTKGASVHGDYSFDWVSPSQWKEVIRIRNYERVRVGAIQGYWQSSTLSYRPEIIFRLDTMLHLKDALKLESKQTLAKVKRREKDGVRQFCSEVKWQLGTVRTLCFDQADGALASIEYPEGGLPNPPYFSRVEYSDFHSLAGKLVPYEIRALRDRKVIAAVKVLDISRNTVENPPPFSVPANAELWSDCDDMREAELINQVMPKYPDSAKTNHIQGRVVLYAVVETDGSLSHMALLEPAAPDLEAVAAKAVRQWRYKPAACGQSPIRVETRIEVIFSLEH